MPFQSTTKPAFFALSLGFLLLGACADEPATDDAEIDTDMSSADSTGGSTTAAAETTEGPEPTGTGDTTTGEDPTGEGSTGEGSTTGGDATDDVVEIAIRRLNEGQDLGEFEAARDAFVALLTMQPGVGTDREFESFLDYAVFMPPTPPVFIGMTQYDDLDAFMAAGEAVGPSPEAAAFFSTFTPELFTVLVPLEPGAAVDLAGVASEPGHVLEIAVRDLSTYAAFDPVDYAGKRDAFLALLAAQPGFVAEYQWVSALDPDVAVGMTVYASAEAFAAISQDEAFLGAAEVGEFLGTYPPAGGHVSTVVH